MSVSVTVNGIGYTIPTVGETDWGANVTSWIQGISGATLQKAGGTFTMTADADLGGSFGLKGIFKSRSSNVASTGVLRIANNEAGPVWRNAANNADLALSVDSSNNLEFNSVDVALVTGVVATPGGRVTLISGTPLTTSDVTGATTVYYSPFRHNQIWLYDGTTWKSNTFTELSQTTADATKSPAAVANNSNYDLFVWSDSGTLRCTRGPAWPDDTSRGSGAGTTELELFEGRYVNAAAITNGPAARRGLYVGTIRSDGSAQINDSAAKRHVWNTYNRALRHMRVIESTDSWNYTTAAYRQANGSAANQLDMVIGLSEDTVNATVIARASNSSAGVFIAAGIGLDSTTTNSAQILANPDTLVVNLVVHPQAFYSGFPGLGRHYMAWLEYSAAAGTTTWRGDSAAPTISQCGIVGEILA